VDAWHLTRKSGVEFRRIESQVETGRTVMVIKRSMGAGFAGIENPLYYLDKTLMLFGDAKSFVGNVIRELSGGHG
jgi:NAD(P) transhydrogenase subunit beta